MVMGGDGLVLRTTGLDSWPIHVGYVVDKVALSQVSLPDLLSPLSVSFTNAPHSSSSTRCSYQMN